MAIQKRVDDHFDKTKTPIDKVVDELAEIAKAKLDASWDDVSGNSMSKIHAEIMSEVFVKFGRQLMKL